MRRVVTGHDGGRAAIESDGPPPATLAVPSGFGVSEVLWLDGPPADATAGGDREGPGFPLEPPPGGLSCRVIRMPPGGDWLRVDGDDDDRPGMHATDTLDLMIVLSGSIVLDLHDGERTLGPGDVVVQQGTPHRWRVAGDEPCTYVVTMLRPDPSRPAVGLAPSTAGGSGVRRVVTGSPVLDGEVPDGMRAGGTVLLDLWQTGGPLASPTQGGDAEGPWTLEPLGGGVAFRWLEMAPRSFGPDEGWHTTATIDVDVLLQGRLALELPGGVRAELAAGDVVIQRGTEHRWLPIGDEPVRMAAVMLAVPA